MKKDINQQVIKFEILKDQLATNHDNLTKWNHIKKKKYDNQKEDLLGEKLKWDKA
jgi:hypothetical protein